MSNPMIEDAAAYPDLFDFKLPATPQEVEAVENQLGARLPPSFCEVLEAIGQGSFFDNETLLGVHEADELTGDLERINRELREKQRLPEHLIVFHIGLGGLHAFDTSAAGPEYAVVTLDEDTLAKGPVYDSFDSWYLEWMREEYASILGLE